MTAIARRIWRRFGSIDGAAASGGAVAIVFTISVIAMLPLRTMPIDAYGLDVAHMLLAVNLIAEGRGLHTDVLTPLGDLAFRPFVWGAMLSDTASGALVYGRLINGAVVALLTPLVCLRRLSAFPAAVVGAAMMATALMPMQFGEAPWLLSSAMEYNKVGFALAGLGFLLLIPRLEASSARLADAALATLIVALCFHLKITYALGLAAALAVGWFAQGRTALAAYILMLVLALSATSWPYLASINGSGLNSYADNYNFVYPIYLIVSNFELFALYCASALAFHLIVRKRAHVATSAVIFAFSFLIVTQNAQQLLIPSAAIAIIYLHEILRRSLVAEGRAAPVALVFGALTLVYPAVLVGDWLLGVWHYNSAQRSASSFTIEEGAFKGFRVDLSNSPASRQGEWSCTDAGLLRNQLVQVMDLNAVFEAEGLAKSYMTSGEPVEFAYVDHVDFVVLGGYSAMGSGRILWRVTERDIGTQPDDVIAIFIPRFSKLRGGYLAKYGDRIAALGFRSGSVGCLDYFVRNARN